MEKNSVTTFHETSELTILPTIVSESKPSKILTNLICSTLQLGQWNIVCSAVPSDASQWRQRGDASFLMLYRYLPKHPWPLSICVRCPSPPRPGPTLLWWGGAHRSLTWSVLRVSTRELALSLTGWGQEGLVYLLTPTNGPGRQL